MNNKCVDKCYANYLPNEENICMPCSEFKLKIEDDKCVFDCSINNLYNKSNNTCEPVSKDLAEEDNKNNDNNDSNNYNSDSTDKNPTLINNKTATKDSLCICLNGSCLESINEFNKNCIICNCNNKFYGELCKVDAKVYEENKITLNILKNMILPRIDSNSNRLSLNEVD